MKPLLVALILGLAVLLTWQWRAWPPAPPGAPTAIPAAPKEASQQAQDNPSIADAELFAERLPGDYVSVIERPLFQPNRRPPEDETEAEPESEKDEIAELDTVDVAAIVIAAPQSSSVWLHDANLGPKAERFRVGDDYQGWRISVIEPHWIELERQGRTERLLLQDFSKPPAKPPSPLQPRRVRR